MLTRLTDLQAQVSATSRTLGHLSPVGRIRTLRQRVDDLTERAGTAQSAQLRLHRERLTGQSRALEAANPAAILKRGYAMVRRASDGTPITRAAEASPDTALTIQFHDGEVKARTD